MLLEIEKKDGKKRSNRFLLFGEKLGELIGCYVLEVFESFTKAAPVLVRSLRVLIYHQAVV